MNLASYTKYREDFTDAEQRNVDSLVGDAARQSSQEETDLVKHETNRIAMLAGCYYEPRCTRS